MRSRDEIQAQLDSCQSVLNDSFFGGTIERVRYYRNRVQFLEWVLGHDVGFAAPDAGGMAHQLRAGVAEKRLRTMARAKKRARRSN